MNNIGELHSSVDANDRWSPLATPSLKQLLLGKYSNNNKHLRRGVKLTKFPSAN